MNEPAPTLLHRYREVVRERPDDVAVIEPDGREVSAGQLVARAERAAAGLQSLGLEPGSHLGVFLPNRSTWLVAALAAARAGVGILGLNTRFREAELDHLLGVAGVDTVLVADEFLGTDGPSLMAGLARPPRVLVDGPSVPDGAVAWSTVEAGGTGQRADPLPGVGPTDPLIGFTTSGTTGFPKIAMHTGAQTLAHLEAVIPSFGLDRSTVTLVPLPLCGAFGYSLALSTLLAGGRVVLHDTWDPDRAAADLAHNGVTWFSASDDMLLAVEASPAFDGAETSWTTGGFADFTNSGQEAVRRLEGATGGTTRLAGLYGSSEGFALMSTFDHRAPMEERWANGGHLVGAAMGVRACDPDTDAVLPHGQPGELQFRGPNLIEGYLNNPEATARAFTDDGWYRSGDLGHTIEADARGHQGFVYLARMGDSLRLRGFLCDPAEIENHLERHPSVDLAQVVGVRRPGTGDVAVAFVRLAAGPPVDEAELTGHCREGLANYKRPERIVVVDDFPVTDGPNGVKIRKVELRERAAQLIGS